MIIRQNIIVYIRRQIKMYRWFLRHGDYDLADRMKKEIHWWRRRLDE